MLWLGAGGGHEGGPMPEPSDGDAGIDTTQDLHHPVYLESNGELTFQVIWVETQILLFHF